MTTGANTCVVHAGRLLEIVVGAGYHSVADVDEMIRLIGATIARQPVTKRVVIAADWRRCRVFTPEVADRARMMLESANPRVERSAILHLTDQPTSTLQVLRIVREAHHNDNRRLFTDTTQMARWLGEVLDEAEQARVRAFLSEPR